MFVARDSNSGNGKHLVVMAGSIINVIIFLLDKKTILCSSSGLDHDPEDSIGNVVILRILSEIVEYCVLQTPI